MTDKHRTQAMGEGTKKETPGEDRKILKGTGESAGGAYPNPHTGGEDDDDKKNWPGGQSEPGYYGPGQLGDKEIKPGGNPNSGSKR